MVTGPVHEYELDHLATFTVSPKQGLVRPDDGIKRLRDMESTSGVWAMKVHMKIDKREIVISERASNRVLQVEHNSIAIPYCPNIGTIVNADFFAVVVTVSVASYSYVW